MEIDKEIQIRILNKENFLGRPCTEKEKDAEIAKVHFYARRPKAIPQEIDKEHMLELIKSENLDDYVHVVVNSYYSPGEYSVLLNKIEEFYTVLATGERGTILLNSVFPKVEQAYYCLLEHMRSVKKEFERYNYKSAKNFDNKGDGR